MKSLHQKTSPEDLAPELTAGAQVKCLMQVCEQRLPGRSNDSRGMALAGVTGTSKGKVQRGWAGAQKRKVTRGKAGTEEVTQSSTGEGKKFAGGAMENHGGALRRQTGHD